MASIEMVSGNVPLSDNFPQDGGGPGGQFHATEMHNLMLAIMFFCGVAARSYTLTVTGADMVITIPPFVAVVPDGSGSFVLVEKTSATNVTITAAHATLPRVDVIVVDVAGNVTATAGTPTDESDADDDVEEAPMAALANDEIALVKVKVGANVSVIATNQVFGRAVHTDVYRERMIQGWVADDATNPSIGNLPANTVPGIPHAIVTEAFDSDGTDQITVGTDGDPDAYAVAVDVSSTGYKNAASGVDAWEFNAAAKAVEAYYTAGGSAATAGKALVMMEYRFVEPQVA